LYLKELLFFAKGRPLCLSILREFRQWCEDLLTEDPNFPDLLVTEASKTWYAANFQYKTPRLSPKAVAERLGISRENIQKLIEADQPSAAGQLNRSTYDPAEIDELLRRHWTGSESDHDRCTSWLTQQEYVSSLGLLTIEQVAKLLRVNNVTILRWSTNGSLPCYDLPIKKGAHSYRYIKPQIEKLAAFCEGQKCTIKRVQAFQARHQAEMLDDATQSEVAGAH
jgi:predicted DNA-binding transcriptional regulator AlpA